MQRGAGRLHLPEAISAAAEGTRGGNFKIKNANLRSQMTRGERVQILVALVATFLLLGVDYAVVQGHWHHAGTRVDRAAGVTLAANTVGGGVLQARDRAADLRASRSLAARHRLDRQRAAARLRAADARRRAAQRALQLRAAHLRSAQHRHSDDARGVTPVWRALAQCESSGNWADTAGEYEGGVQFLNSTWLSYGGGRYAQHAYDATPLEQVTIARKVLNADGPSQWPVCGPRVGLQRGD